MALQQCIEKLVVSNCSMSGHTLGLLATCGSPEPIIHCDGIACFPRACLAHVANWVESPRMPKRSGLSPFQLGSLRSFMMNGLVRR